MRILHTADWHLGRRLEGRPRHEEQILALDEICRIADDEAVDVVLVAGDVFDTYNPPAESEALFYQTMTRLSANGRRAVIVIAGNHDSPDRLIASNPYARALGITTLGYPKDLPTLYDWGSDRAACVDAAQSFVRLRVPGSSQVLSVLALPYPSEARLRELLTADINDEEGANADYNARVRGFMEESARGFLADGPNLIASHLFVRGGLETESERPISVGGAYSVDSTSFPTAAGYVALGHLHRQQEMAGRDDLRIRYSGSLLQYSFSEAEQEKSVTIVEYDGPRATWRPIALAAGRRLHQWTAHGTDELEHRLREWGPEDWHHITLELDGPIAPDYLHNLRRAAPGIVQCLTRYADLGEAGADVPVSTLPITEQFRRYVGMKFNEPCNDAVMRLFLELASGGADDG